jgi:hypothetical protein
MAAHGECGELKSGACVGAVPRRIGGGGLKRHECGGCGRSGRRLTSDDGLLAGARGAAMQKLRIVRLGFGTS